VGLVVAAVPLLPYASQWLFYSNTALCVPLSGGFSHSGSTFQFALDGVFLAAVMVLVAASQIIICKAQSGVSFLNTPASDTEGHSRVADMHQGVFKISVLFCVRGAVLSSANLVVYLNDVAVDEDVAASLAIFLGNMYTALNPCVYVVNHARADRTREAQRRMMQLLKQRTAQIEREHLK
jgi:hypothetical protein